MNRIGILFFSILLFVGCGQKSGLTAWEVAQSVTIKRGACLGACPIYNVTIHRNGKVDFEGIRFIEPEGKLSFSLSDRDNTRFWKMADQIEFAGYDTLYPCKIADLPSSTFVFENENTKKTIVYQCEPAEVFIDLMDEVNMMLGQYLPKESAK